MANTEYMIVLGDLDNRHSNSMLDRMKKLGKLRQIMDNVFILHTPHETNMNDLRSKIAGEENGYCIVFKIDNRISFAWSLTPANSDFLSQLIEEEQDAKE